MNVSSSDVTKLAYGRIYLDFFITSIPSSFFISNPIYFLIVFLIIISKALITSFGAFEYYLNKKFYYACSMATCSKLLNGLSQTIDAILFYCETTLNATTPPFN